MNRYITFTFDDGLINTAKIVKRLEIPTTFYIVLGWVTKEIEVNDSFNFYLDHGTIKEWKNLKIDIGCHTYDHKKNFDEHLSYRKFSQFFNGFKNLSTPYSLKYNSKLYDSCKIGFFNKPYNELKQKSLKQIHSINPNYDFFDKDDLKSIIANCPDQHWMVFTFHGINEGWEPIKYEDLKFWINFFIEKKFTFMSMTEGVEKICKKYLL